MSSNETVRPAPGETDIDKRYPFLRDEKLSDDLKKHLISTAEARDGAAFSQSMERSKWRWNTPLVLALIALIGTAANFAVDVSKSNNEAQNALTLSSFNSRMDQDMEVLKGQIGRNADEAEYEQQLEMQETQFQYKIVERTLDQNLPESDRAEALLFWIRAGVLDKLNQAALEEMANTSLSRTRGTIDGATDGPFSIGVPQLSGPSAGSETLRDMPDTALKLIASFEGFREMPVDEGGSCLVGYSHSLGAPCADVAELLTANGWNDGVTPEEAQELLKSDTVSFRKAVQSMVVGNLNDDQFGALVSFAFNAGAGALRTSGISAKLNDGRYTDAQWLLMNWQPRSAGAKTLSGLRLRRVCEASLFAGRNLIDAKGDFDRKLCGLPDPRYGSQE